MKNGRDIYSRTSDLDTETLLFLLKKEHYRYQLAIRDGALLSITDEVIKTIRALEEELERRNGNGRS